MICSPDISVLETYFAQPNKGNWSALVEHTANNAYIVALAALGDERKATQAVREAYRQLYRFAADRPADQLLYSLMEVLLAECQRLSPLPLLGDGALTRLRAPEISDDFIPAAMLTDSTSRAFLMEALAKQPSSVRVGAWLTYGFGMPAAEICALLNCDEATLLSYLNAANAALKLCAEALREAAHMRLYAPETMAALLNHEAPAMPATLLSHILRATSGSIWLNFATALHRTLNMRRVSMGSSVRASIAGSAAGGIAVGGAIIVCNAVVVGAVSLGIWAGVGNPEATAAYAANFRPAAGQVQMMLSSEGYVPPPKPPEPVPMAVVPAPPPPAPVVPEPEPAPEPAPEPRPAVVPPPPIVEYLPVATPTDDVAPEPVVVTVPDGMLLGGEESDPSDGPHFDVYHMGETTVRGHGCMMGENCTYPADSCPYLFMP